MLKAFLNAAPSDLPSVCVETKHPGQTGRTDPWRNYGPALGVDSATYPTCERSNPYS